MFSFMFFFKSGGAEPKFDCENYGDQGITAGCKDIYHANIDCQWLDVTELELGTYIFKMSINPQYKASIFQFPSLTLTHSNVFR